MAGAILTMAIMDTQVTMDMVMATATHTTTDTDMDTHTTTTTLITFPITEGEEILITTELKPEEDLTIHLLETLIAVQKTLEE